MGRAAGVVVVGLVAMCAAQGSRASAQPRSVLQQRSVRVEPPACASISFSHAQLVSLLAVELAVHRMSLVGGEADAVVVYEAQVCGSARLLLSIDARDQPPTRVEVSGLGARALALLIAELLREPVEVAAELEPAPEPVRTAHLAAALGTPGVAPRRARETPRRTTARLGAALATPASTSRAAERDAPRPAEDAPPPAASRTLEDVSLVGGALLTQFLYNPENQAWLLGPQIEVMVRMPFWRELRVHLDGSLGAGTSQSHIDVATVAAGLWIGITIGGPDLALELGPRIWITYLWPVSQLNPGFAIGIEGMLALGGVARLTTRLDGAVSLVVDAELGGNLTSGIRFYRTHPDYSPFGGIYDPFAIFRAGVMLD